MRRTLAAVALFLLLAAVELATGGVGYVLARFQAGLVAVSVGVEFHTPAPRFVVGLAVGAAGLVLAGMLVWSSRVAHEVEGIGAACPDCAEPTERVKRKPFHKMLGLLIGHRLTRRRCPACGWIGLSLRH